MLIDAACSTLLIVDMQQKLVPAIEDHQRIVQSCVWLAQLATLCGVPALASEHYAKGLGPTVEPIRAALPANAYLQKVHFSCVAADCFDNRPELNRKQLVIAGIEAHVCVLQPAIDWRRAGHEVFVVADAVGARSVQDKALGLERMRDCGVAIVSREMVGFEWVKQAATPLFKEFSSRFLR